MVIIAFHGERSGRVPTSDHDQLVTHAPFPDPTRTPTKILICQPGAVRDWDNRFRDADLAGWPISRNPKACSCHPVEGPAHTQPGMDAYACMLARGCLQFINSPFSAVKS